VKFLNVLDGAGEDGAFVLFAAGDDLGEFVDAFVDGFAAASLDWLGRFVSVLLKCATNKRGGVDETSTIVSGITDLLCGCPFGLYATRRSRPKVSVRQHRRCLALLATDLARRQPVLESLDDALCQVHSPRLPLAGS